MVDVAMTPSGVAELMLQEGTVLHTYRDATGTLTCCTGHTAAAGAPIPAMGQTYTREQAADILAADLGRIYMPAVAKLVARPMLPHQADAFGSFTFNAGAGNFASSTMLRCFNAGDLQGAADGFLAWTKSKGVVLPGLVKRRQVERGMFLDGTYPGVVLALPDTGQAMKDQHMIAKGATGADVVTLQMQLNTAGYPVKSDGSFGPTTEGAVRAFQAARGLPVDGVVGLKTWLALDKATDPAPAVRSSVVRVDADKPVLAGIERAIDAAAVEQGAVAGVAVPKPAPVAASASVPTAGPAHLDVVKLPPRTGLVGLWDRITGRRSA